MKQIAPAGHLIAGLAVAAAIFASQGPTASSTPTWQRVYGAWLNGRFCRTAYGGGTDDSRPVFADLDGDGDLDLIVGDLDGGINVYRRLWQRTVARQTWQLYR